jgi:carboxymethylenebutenolidase
MNGTMIEIPTGDGASMGAYLALPESGSGAGLVLLQEIFGINQSLRKTADLFAEEGYVTIVPDLFWRIEPGTDLGYSEAEFGKAIDLMAKFDLDQGIEDIGATLKALRAREECTGKAGCVGFCLGGKLAYLTAARQDVDVAVSFYGVGIEGFLAEAGNISCPLQMHFAALDQHVPEAAVAEISGQFDGYDNVEIYIYPNVDHAFYNHGRPSVYNRPASMMAHSRTIAALHKVMGPHFNLETLWDEHLKYEFATRDTQDTLATMVGEPYVNHVPVMTGGTGVAELERFYANHFIPQMPKDTSLVPISRTIGADRVVDEMIFCFTHDEEIDWMLPGISPTGKTVEIPLIAVVNFRGGKLYHEHIYWDQASVLVQIGKLDPAGLPIAGVETANKVKDKSLPSNTLMARWAESAPKADT